ncbi:MAG: Cna B-type domain-containing protein [Oscillospiraceae bacterium]|nr:Cna B-type domain-containing protein [Oscillospiraceae bacterium]
MDQRLPRRAEQFYIRRRHRRIWKKIVSFLGCIVVFCTTYALILPAITQEVPIFCGLEEHVHTEDCFIPPEGYSSQLDCTAGEDLHVHGEECFDETGELVCGLADYLAHSHDEQCFDASGELICPLPEREQHIHGEACYELVGGHSHGEECYTYEKGEFICTLPETEGHAHENGCFERGELLCTLPEIHEHGEGCFGEIIVCTVPEGHAHDESCFTVELTCTLPEDENHTHGGECFTETLTCTTEEGHIHGASCREETLLCTETGHVHEDGCYALTLVCTLPEEEGHTHGDLCYERIATLVCTQEEIPGEPVLICTEPEAEVHVHDETCFTTVLPDELTCTEDHEHRPWCYGVWEQICSFEEHTHSLACHSDPEADTEDADIWEATFAGTELTGIWADDLIAIAESQRGYSESTANFLVAEDGETVSGYTRYGQWADDPYGEWNSYFIAFCLEYAGIEGVPFDSDPEKWTEELREAGLWAGEGESALPGDLVFFETDGGIRCGILSALDEEGETPLLTLIGEQEGRVSHIQIPPDDPALLGFAMLPENPGPALFCGLEEHLHDECDELECPLTEHLHGIVCTVDMDGAAPEDRQAVGEVILLIEDLPSADEIDEKIWEFEEAEDYEAEEAWLTEIYRLVAHAYSRYDALSDDLKEFVINRDKLLEMEYIWSAFPLIEIDIAMEADYQNVSFDSGASFVFYTEGENGYYAFDGNGTAVPVHVSGGIITADVADRDTLLWTFKKQSDGSYIIQNVSTGRYMHAYGSNGSSTVTTTSAYGSFLVSTADGLRVRSNTEYAYLDENTGTFRVTKTAGSAALYQVGIAEDCIIWLDGSCGTLDSFYGSPSTRFSAAEGTTFLLPETWESPDKYAYVLRGWYDVVNGKWYPPGAKAEVTGNTVFYADWVAASYDIGEFNAQTVDTVSTNQFIDVRVFDYNALFNVYSTNPTVTINASGHDETWRLVTGDGKVAHENGDTLGYIFRDWDDTSELSYPNNTNGANTYDGNITVYPGLYSPELADILFDPDSSFDPETGEGVIGKQYLGRGDYLFRYGNDPGEPEHYGYFYYDSSLNAASYNQSDERFYVYNYLEKTSASSGSGAEGNSDFLPLNSPYENLNGNTVGTYSYDGVYGEYEGTAHCLYSADESTSGRAGSNFWFGMTADIDFYLPSVPGTRDAEGNMANLSVYGDELTFEFSGDDDVWVLVDGELVLDLGGIHGVESGTINFSTGEVTVNGNVEGSVTHIGAGRHTLTMYYLERGSSQSNCKLRFNISSRYSFSLQKEDTLSREILNGAEFSVYTDAACTVPAELWENREDYLNDVPGQHVFTVKNGKASMWGFAAGNTYYIKETKPPGGYDPMSGIIVMKLNNLGVTSYEVIPDPTADGDLTGGFTVHGFKIDYETQEAFLVATNSRYTDEVTSVEARKKWADGAAHTGESVTVYLWADGVRLREAVLNEDNDWKILWENLPKYASEEDAEAGKAVVYTVTEGTVPGYIGRVEMVTEYETGGVRWEQATSFQNGGVYLLVSNSGALRGSDNNLSWIDKATAEGYASAQWVASNVNGDTVNLTNRVGQTLYFDGNAFRSGGNPSSGKDIRFGSGRLYYPGTNQWWNRYANSLGNGRIYYTSNASDAIQFTLYREVVTTSSGPAEGEIPYQITNSPVDETVDLNVRKVWNLSNMASVSDYEQLTVTVHLLANGVDTGIEGKINLQSGWQTTFADLPAVDQDGNEIVYTVEEDRVSPYWVASYEHPPDSDTITVTNTYVPTYRLPETGGRGTIPYALGGILLILAGALLVYNHLAARGKGANTS